MEDTNLIMEYEIVFINKITDDLVLVIASGTSIVNVILNARKKLIDLGHSSSMYKIYAHHEVVSLF